MTQRSPVVLVTGTSSGIGQAIASAFAAKGFEVFGTGRNPQRTEPIAGVEPLQPIVRLVEASVYVRYEQGGLLFGPAIGGVALDNEQENQRYRRRDVKNLFYRPYDF